MISIGPTQELAIFWAVAVTVFFNIPYLLSIMDARSKQGSPISKAKVGITMLIGTLIVIATYAETLKDKSFALSDCMLLALVAAHGWTAEGMVQKFLDAAAEKVPAAAEPEKKPA